MVDHVNVGAVDGPSEAVVKKVQVYILTLSPPKKEGHSENAQTTTRAVKMHTEPKGAQLEHIDDWDRQSYRLFYSTISVDSMQAYTSYIRLVRRHKPTNDAKVTPLPQPWSGFLYIPVNPFRALKTPPSTISK